MAGVSGAGPVPEATQHRGWRTTLALGSVIVALAALRIAAWGWSPAAPDDARYVFVGLRLLDGAGAVTPEGLPYLVRAPAYPLALALGSQLGGADPFAGAHVVAWMLSLAALVGAIALASRLAGPAAGAAAAAAVAGAALLWNLLPTLRIDLPQAAGVVGVLLLLVDARTTARWLAAGLLLGLTILVKESVILLALLPVAWVGRQDAPALVRRTGAFWIGIAAAAGWWWLLVWLRAGVIFPANGLAMIESRQVGSELDVEPLGLVALAIGAAAWLATTGAAVGAPRLRLLVLAGVLVLPPAAYAMWNGLSARNLVVPAVLTVVAIGVATAILWRRISSHPDSKVRHASLVAICAVALLLVVAGQDAVSRPSPNPVQSTVAAWLAGRTAAGEQVAATFRGREILAVELLGESVAVRTFDPVRVPPGADAGSYLWLGVRDEQLFGYPREAVRTLLGDPRTRYVIVTQPHPLAPAELVADDGTGAAAALGLTARETIEGGRETSVAFEVDPAVAGAAAATAPLRATAPGALGYLAGGNPRAPASFLAASPYVTGTATELDAVAARLDPGACRTPVAGPDATGRMTERFAAASSDGCP